MPSWVPACDCREMMAAIRAGSTPSLEDTRLQSDQERWIHPNTPDMEETHTGSNTHLCPTLLIASLNFFIFSRSLAARRSEASVPGTSGSVVNNCVHGADTIKMFAEVDFCPNSNPISSDHMV